MLVNFGLLNLADNTTLVAGAAGNMVAPDYFDSISFAGDGTYRFHAATKTARLATVAGGGAAQFRKTITAGQVVVEIEYHQMPWPTTAALRLVEIRNAGDTAVAGRLNLRTDGKVEFTDGGNAWRWEAASAVPTTEGWRVVLRLKKGTTTANGEVHVALYNTGDGKGTSTAANNRWDVTNQNVGTTDLNVLRAGFTSGGPGTEAIRNVQWKTDTFTEFGPVLAAAALVRTENRLIEVDYTGSTMSGTPVLTAVQQSGPVMAISVTGLIARVTDSLSRNAPAVIEFTLSNGTQTLSEEVEYKPIGMPATQRLVSAAGAWT